MRTLAAALLVWLAAPLAEPQTVKETLEITREAVESQRRILVSGALPLTDAEAQAFWPLYDSYERERRKLDERANRMVAAFVAAATRLTDAEADAMMDEALRVDEERLRLRREWRARLARALPPRKLVRFFQIESKLDAVVRADVSRQIPLVP